MQLDHIIIATTDLDRSARQLAETAGLAAVEGGIHDGLGTRNYIVPLGCGYLEFVAVHDADLAKGNPFGQLVLSVLSNGDEAFAGWAVEVTSSELETRARHDKLPIGRLTRRGLGVNHIGMTRALISPGLPFFLARDPGSTNPGMMDAAHTLTPRGVKRISVAGNQADLDAWLMTHVGPDNPKLPVACGSPGRGITQVDIETDQGALTLTHTAPTTARR